MIADAIPWMSARKTSHFSGGAKTNDFRRNPSASGAVPESPILPFAVFESLKRRKSFQDFCLCEPRDARLWQSVRSSCRNPAKAPETSCFRGLYVVHQARAYPNIRKPFVYKGYIVLIVPRYQAA